MKSNLEICKTILKIGSPFVGLIEGNKSSTLKAICPKLVIATLFMTGKKNERKEGRKEGKKKGRGGPS